VHTGRALLAIDDLLHKISGAACFLHLKLAETNKIACLGTIWIAQSDPCLLGLRIVLLTVRIHSNSVVVVIVFVAVGSSIIYITIAYRQALC